MYFKARLTRGIEHDQGVLLLLQGLPEVLRSQVADAGGLVLPRLLRGWGSLGAGGGEEMETR